MARGRAHRGRRLCGARAVIFVTTGTQLPFPRLIDEMDRLAPTLGEPVIAQVGPDAAPRENLDLRRHLSPGDFDAVFRNARVVVAHAGIGTVLSARRFGKPLILVPRRFALGEHRNDHQVATAEALQAVPGLYVAWDEKEIGPLLTRGDLVAAEDSPGPDLAPLVAAVRGFLSS